MGKFHFGHNKEEISPYTVKSEIELYSLPNIAEEPIKLTSPIYKVFEETPTFTPEPIIIYRDVEVLKEVEVFVDRVVETVKEVPVEVVKEIEVIKERIVYLEKEVEKPVIELVEKIVEIEKEIKTLVFKVPGWSWMIMGVEAITIIILLFK